MVRTSSPLTRLALAGALSLLGAFPLAGCQDLEEPLALAVAPETHGALLLSQELPSIPLLLSGTEKGEESAEVEAWWDSWRMEEEDGERVRSRIYLAAAQRLLPAMGREGVRNLLARNGENLRAVEADGLLTTSPAVQDALSRATALHHQAEAALRAGNAQGALALALRSVDAQWAVSPPRVAASLLEQAEESLGRNAPGDSYSEEVLARIRRLTRGAREALDQGDYPRAIRRAYYACQLLGAG